MGKNGTQWPKNGTRGPVRGLWGPRRTRKGDPGPLELRGWPENHTHVSTRPRQGTRAGPGGVPPPPPYALDTPRPPAPRLCPPPPSPLRWRALRSRWCLGLRLGRICLGTLLPWSLRIGVNGSEVAPASAAAPTRRSLPRVRGVAALRTRRLRFYNSFTTTWHACCTHGWHA
jgi:hypothetical protein